MSGATGDRAKAAVTKALNAALGAAQEVASESAKHRERIRMGHLVQMAASVAMDPKKVLALAKAMKDTGVEFSRENRAPVHAIVTASLSVAVTVLMVAGLNESEARAVCSEYLGLEAGSKLGG